MMIYENKYLIENETKKDVSLFGAFPSGSVILFEVTCAGFHSLTMVIHSDGLSDGGENYLSLEFCRSGDVFSREIAADDLLALSSDGLFYYHYEALGAKGVTSFSGEAPTELTKDGWERQLLIYDSSFTTPDFLKGGMIYHVFVDRFKSSGKCKVRDGGILNTDWENGIPQYPEKRGGDLKNNEFFGGDLYGVANKLDYIRSLGVTTLYLSPIFDSVSNHKYDTSDYMKVDSAFGGDKALATLIKECKKRGMHIILDGVFNHTGDDSVYFDKYSRYDSGAYSSSSSPYAEWYTFGEDREQYSCWWNIKILPKVNCDAPSYREYIFGENGVIRKYMRMGIDGFRLDVADELSSSFLEEMRRVVREEDPDGIVLGEVWEDASNKIAYSERRHYFSGRQLDSVMNYPLREGILAFIKYGDFQTLRFASETVYRHYPKQVSDVLMNFLGTHDTKRILTALAGSDSESLSNSELAHKRLSESERQHGLEMLRCAFAICALTYGVPSVFYGDEAGLEGYHDPFCRMPYPWGHEDKETVAFFTAFGALRRDHKLFADGFFKIRHADENAYVFERFNDEETITVVVTRGLSYKACFDTEVICLFGLDEGKTATSFDVGKWSVGVFSYFL